MTYSTNSNDYPITKNTDSRKIILVSLNWGRDKDPRHPLGHASIFAALKSAGREVIEIVCNVNKQFDITLLSEKILSVSGGKDTDLCIGAYVWNDAVLKEFLPLLRSRGFTGRIIIGGPQITYTNDNLEILYPEADIFIRGFGESALLAVTAITDKLPINGVSYKGVLPVFSINDSPLDNLASPWDSHDWTAEPLKHLRWETARGCPYRCSFCQHRAVHQNVYPFAKERVLREAQLFCNKKVDSIAILDPIFPLSPYAVDALKVFAENNFKGEISIQCRPESISDKFLELASKLNVLLEFGLQTIHLNESEAINRRNNIKKIELTLAKVRKLGIKHLVTLIFGLPLQTLESFKETVNWCLERRIPVIKAFPLMILRGTLLEKEAYKWNLRQSDGGMACVISSDTFSESDWQEMNAISEKLKETEGKHPAAVDELSEKTAVSFTSSDLSRWIA
ncbi:MAG: radical SAM protein [Planctomycetaceae bacterium]|jgi:radical SAM superfamily enzyme YgiQ (UPF0313 family)|nr:radical SAM protein [Planctomycetaceae bacterium]